MEIVGVTYNLMAAMSEPIRFTGQMERMERISSVVVEQLDTLAPVDFMCVQESMGSTQHLVLSDGLRAVGFAYESVQVSGALKDLKVVQGGLVVFSRHPIVKQEQCVFEVCTREDCLAAKGAVYVQINKLGQIFHIFTLHIQAWESPSSRATRRGQLEQFREFMTQQGIPASQPVIVIGDFNVDWYSERKQIMGFMSLLSCQPLRQHEQSHPFTSDPSTNQLMGLDDPQSYTSPDYPRGCADYYLKYMHCPCCPREWLDYATVSRQHLPIDERASWMRVVPAKVKPFWMNVTLTRLRQISDLSDHYPLLARFVFPDLEQRRAGLEQPTYHLSSLRYYAQKPGRNRAMKFMIFSLVGTIAIMSLFLMAWLTRRRRFFS